MKTLHLIKAYFQGAFDGTKWSDKVKTKPMADKYKGLFTKNAQEIVNGLTDEAKGDLGLAIKKITFYLNRASKSIPNRKEVEKAKQILIEKRNKEKK